MREENCNLPRGICRILVGRFRLYKIRCVLSGRGSGGRFEEKRFLFSFSFLEERRGEAKGEGGHGKEMFVVVLGSG